jgi:type I restriction enzyme R subunit
LEVKLSDDRVLKIINIDTRYIDEHGRPLSATDFLKSLIGKLPNIYDTEAQLREIWANPDTRDDLLHKLHDIGVDQEQLDALKVMFEAKDSDIFDVLAHISFNSDIKKRVERTQYVKNSKIIFSHYEDLKAQDFLGFLLEQYEVNGVLELSKNSLKGLVELYKGGSISEVSQVF